MTVEFDIDNYLSDKDEEKLKDKIEEILKTSKRFSVFREVKGKMRDVHPLKEKNHGSIRLDLLVVPNALAISEGWQLGAVALEVKGRNKEEKYHKVISQAIDYQNSVYEMPSNSVLIQPSFTAIFPFRVTHAASSILSQFGCGTATIKREEFSLSQNGAKLATVKGESLGGKMSILSGRKVGSR